MVLSVVMYRSQNFLSNREALCCFTLQNPWVQLGIRGEIAWIPFGMTWSCLQKLTEQLKVDAMKSHNNIQYLDIVRCKFNDKFSRHETCMSVCPLWILWRSSTESRTFKLLFFFFCYSVTVCVCVCVYNNIIYVTFQLWCCHHDISTSLGPYVHGVRFAVKVDLPEEGIVKGVVSDRFPSTAFH